MSEQQDKQRAIEALERAGFTPNGPFRWSRPNMAKQEWVSPDTASLLPYDDGQKHLATFTLYANAEQVPALLNPITKEQAEAAVRHAIKANWHDRTLKEVHIFDWDRLVFAIMARLFPEEAPTDANPG